MSLNEITWTDTAWALFLDVDGTLLEIAETPQGVHVPETTRKLLIRASMHLDGAVALVSGRTLEDIDRLFAPLRPCASGVHGCERRDASGLVSRESTDQARLNDARLELDAFVRRHPGLLLEDKGHGLAVHFRRVPYLSAEVFEAITLIRDRWVPELAILAGKCVFEVRSATRSKGTSIREFMMERPFCGRKPVFIGDDLTDEEGFAAVNELGGVSIRVGPTAATFARYRLPGVSDVIRWLEDFLPACGS